MSDVILFHTVNGGEIRFEAGLVELDGGLPAAAYLSLFGGNEVGPTEWWGDTLETDGARLLGSRLARLRPQVPLLPVNLPRIEDAAKADLQWFLDTRTASLLNVRASIPARNKLQLSVEIGAYGETQQFDFVENWEALPLEVLAQDPEPPPVGPNIRITNDLTIRVIDDGAYRSFNPED